MYRIFREQSENGFKAMENPIVGKQWTSMGRKASSSFSQDNQSSPRIILKHESAWKNTWVIGRWISAQCKLVHYWYFHCLSQCWFAFLEWFKWTVTTTFILQQRGWSSGPKSNPTALLIHCIATHSEIQGCKVGYYKFPPVFLWGTSKKNIIIWEPWKWLPVHKQKPKDPCFFAGWLLIWAIDRDSYNWLSVPPF